MQMVIGTRKWSSWSMRPWLVARRAGIEVEDIVVALRTLADQQGPRSLFAVFASARC